MKKPKTPKVVTDLIEYVVAKEHQYPIVAPVSNKTRLQDEEAYWSILVCQLNAKLHLMCGVPLEELDNYKLSATFFSHEDGGFVYHEVVTSSWKPNPPLPTEVQKCSAYAVTLSAFHKNSPEKEVASVTCIVYAR